MPMQFTAWNSKTDGVRLHRISVPGTNRQIIVNNDELAEIVHYSTKAIGGSNDEGIGGIRPVS